MLRLKRIPHCDTDCTPYVTVNGADGEAYPCKLQHIVCYDTDNDHTYWEWRDVELVSGDTDDYEEQER